MQEGRSKRPATVFLHVVLRSFALIRGQVKLIFAEDGRGDEVLEDPPVSVEWTNHLAPNQEFAHLLCQLPKFLKVDVTVGQTAGTAFIQEVDVFNEETEERDHNLLLAAVGRLRPLGGATERGAVVAEVTGRVHLVLQDFELVGIDFTPGFPQSGHRTHVHPGDDGHEGVEIADVEALLSHVDEELYDTCSVFLLHGHADLSGHQITQSVEPVDVGLQVTGFTLPEETLMVL